MKRRNVEKVSLFPSPQPSPGGRGRRLSGGRGRRLAGGLGDPATAIPAKAGVLKERGYRLRRRCNRIMPVFLYSAGCTQGDPNARCCPRSLDSGFRRNDDNLKLARLPGGRRFDLSETDLGGSLSREYDSGSLNIGDGLPPRGCCRSSRPDGL